MSEHLNSLDLSMNVARSHHESSLVRLQTELSYAEALLGLCPERASEWEPLVARAADLARERLGGGGVVDAALLTTEVEEILAPLAGAAKAYSIYCVGHGHIDMNWMWSWPETVAVTNDTFATVLRLMDEFPEFHYSQSQASVYRIMERFNPELLARIAERVREGRWEVTASHWVECEKNIVGGESLCRHLLYTRQYMCDLFGLAPEDVPIDWAPDTFGHAATVPSYLVRGGVKYLYMHRPGAQGPVRPRAFRWQAPDGSRVLVKNDMECGYNGQIGPHILGLMLNFVRETGLDFSLFVYGVGDHGGGPTRRDLLMGRELNQWPIFPKVELAPIGRFFSRLDTEAVDLPLLDCELNYEFTGCYTTQTVIKKANRFGEKNLADAEIAAAFASRILGNSYPRDKFVTGWRDILFSHFHDILPGSGVHDTRTYTHGLYQETMAETSMIETQALRGIAARIDTRGFAGDADAPWATLRLPTAMGSGVGFRSSDGRVSEAEQSSGSGTRPHVVFNPTAADRREIVTATLWDNAWGWRRHELPRVPFHVTGPDGTKVPAQTVDVGSYWGHDYVRVAFPVEVPAFGFATYAVSEGAVPAVESQVRQLVSDHHCAYARRERQLDGIENEYLRLELDMQGGGIRRLTDVVNGVDLISPDNPSPVLEYGVERPHPMTAWLVDHTGATEAPEVKAIERRSKGPWTVSLEVRCRIGNSEFTVVYELRADDPCLYLHINGTWYERGTPQTGVPVLRLSLPFAMEDVKGSYEIPFGAVDRDCVADEEVPALQWACFRGRTPKGSAGVLLLNDTKHGHALEGSTARVTLIRSSYDPDPLPEVGQHEMHFALRVVDEASDVHAAIAAGNSFNHALRVIGTDLHEGGLPTVAGLVSVPTPGVSVSTLKIAEDGNGLIVRLYESDGAARVAEVKLDSALLGAVRAVTEVDLMERPLDTCTAELVDDATVRVQIPARGIASLLLRLAD